MLGLNCCRVGYGIIGGRPESYSHLSSGLDLYNHTLACQCGSLDIVVLANRLYEILEVVVVYVYINEFLFVQ